MDDIMRLGNIYDLFVIEDAAQSMLSTYREKYLGTIGDIGCLSFHETKNVISGEGGALLVNDDKLRERAEIIWEKGTNRKKFFQGQIDKYSWIDIGSSFPPSELVAAFLYAQLEHAENISKKRKHIYNRYYNALKHLAASRKISLPSVNDNDDCNGHIFYLLTNSLQERMKLIQYLNDNGVNSVFHYIPLHSSPAGIKYGRVAGEITATDKVSDTIIRLPIYYEMTDDETDTVADLITTFYRSK